MIFVMILMFYFLIPVTNTVFNSLLSFVTGNPSSGVNVSGFSLLVSHMQAVIFASFAIVVILLIIYFLILPWRKQHYTGDIDTSPFMQFSKLKQRKVAIWYDIVIVGILLFTSAMMIMIGNYVMPLVRNWQQSVYPSGVFQPTYLTFMNDVWSAMPFLLLFVAAMYLWMRAQKREPSY